MPDDLYRTDILGWSAAQAARLRRVAAGERVNDVDWVNVIEEVEGVGRSELKAVRSFLFRAIEHALKVVLWPDHGAARKWRSEAQVFLSEARLRFEPGMAQHLDLPDVQAKARRAALMAGPRNPLPLPPEASLDSEWLLDDATDADALIARLTAPR